MAVKFTNNASGPLASAINATTTTIVLSAGQGAELPILGVDDFFYATLVDTSNNFEIIKVTARSGDTLTVVRGQEGTIPKSFLAGDLLELRVTAGSLNAIVGYTDQKAGQKAGLADNNVFSGTNTVPTPSVSTDNLQIANTAFVRDIIPAGIISMWSGSIASIPAGWYLCDGTNGTPDLRNRFVVGAGSTYAVGATGGSKDAIVVSHTHTASVTDPGHNHTIPMLSGVGGEGTTANSLTRASGTSTYNETSDTNTTGISVSVASSGTSGTNANLPPYYALAYIMKA